MRFAALHGPAQPLVHVAVAAWSWADVLATATSFTGLFMADEAAPNLDARRLPLVPWDLLLGPKAGSVWPQGKGSLMNLVLEDSSDSAAARDLLPLDVAAATARTALEAAQTLEAQRTRQRDLLRAAVAQIQQRLASPWPADFEKSQASAQADAQTQTDLTAAEQSLTAASDARAQRQTELTAANQAVAAQTVLLRAIVRNAIEIHLGGLVKPGDAIPVRIQADPRCCCSWWRFFDACACLCRRMTWTVIWAS